MSATGKADIPTSQLMTQSGHSLHPKMWPRDRFE
jgi:hypothetical protein